MIDNTNAGASSEARFLKGQAQINAEKDAQRSRVSPEEAARLAIIEEVSKRLDDAEIPFLLFADSTPFNESTKRSTWWQFNKLGYEKDWDTMVKNQDNRRRSLVKTVLCHLSGYIAGSIVCFNVAKQVAAVVQDGEWYDPPQKDSESKN